MVFYILCILNHYSLDLFIPFVQYLGDQISSFLPSPVNLFILNEVVYDQMG
jgi:hypothetical protein